MSAARRRTVWGFSLVQLLVGLAVAVLATSIFLPAFRVQYAAVRLAFQTRPSIEVSQAEALRPSGRDNLIQGIGQVDAQRYYRSGAG